MRRTLVLCALAGVACAPLKSDPLPPVGAPEFGTVLAMRTTELRSGETRGERALWALVSLDPITVAVAVLAVEDDFGRSSISEYDLALRDGATATVRSRYVVKPGQCVMMRRGGEYVVLVAQDAALCGGPATDSQAAAPTPAG